jgi:hypothetical protein
MTYTEFRTAGSTRHHDRPPTHSGHSAKQNIAAETLFGAYSQRPGCRARKLLARPYVVANAAQHHVRHEVGAGLHRANFFGALAGVNNQFENSSFWCCDPALNLASRA